MNDAAMIGVGIAWLAASIFAAEASANCDQAQRIKTIIFLDAVKKIGAKILISVGGRCNVMHQAVMPADFFGNRHVIENVLPAFFVEHTVKWFASTAVSADSTFSGLGQRNFWLARRFSQVCADGAARR